ASIVAETNSVLKVRLPAALFRERAFVVEGKLDGAPGERVVMMRVTTDPPSLPVPAAGPVPVLASATSAAYKRLLKGHAEFRRVFPLFVCFPNVVPTDEV